MLFIKLAFLCDDGILLERIVAAYAQVRGLLIGSTQIDIIHVGLIVIVIMIIIQVLSRRRLYNYTI